MHNTCTIETDDPDDLHTFPASGLYTSAWRRSGPSGLSGGYGGIIDTGQRGSFRLHGTTTTVVCRRRSRA